MTSSQKLCKELQKQLTQLADKKYAIGTKKFFKVGKGDYAEHDQFLGIKIPVLRKLIPKYKALELTEISTLLKSPFNEERLVGLLILVERYKTEVSKKGTYDFYIEHLDYVNNWNLVDLSAHLIIGTHLLHSSKDILTKLVQSKNLWHRRVAMVATLYFIRSNQYDWTLKLAEMLLDDRHDLMHKATGWMLREVGKKDEKIMCAFLEKHASAMPRTMLRYSIERLDKDRQKYFLTKQ